MLTGFEFRQMAEASVGLPIKVQIQDYDPTDTKDFGSACVHEGEHAITDLGDCVTFSCKGTKLSLVHGQFVTVNALRDVKLTEIKAVGYTTSCPYTAVTDIEGSYDIVIKDTTGQTSVNTHINVGAFKGETFEETAQPILNTTYKSDPFNRLLLNYH